MALRLHTSVCSEGNNLTNSTVHSLGSCTFLRLTEMERLLSNTQDLLHERHVGKGARLGSCQPEIGFCEIDMFSPASYPSYEYCEEETSQMNDERARTRI